MSLKNTSHLAGEFLVAGELSRRGFLVSMTFGNAKSVDIFAQKGDLTHIIDAKAVRSKSNWPVNANTIDKTVMYVFVYLGTEKNIKQCLSPEYFVVSGKDLIENNLISTWGGEYKRQGVRYKALKDNGYENNWEIFE